MHRWGSEVYLLQKDIFLVEGYIAGLLEDGMGMGRSACVISSDVTFGHYLGR